MIEFSEPEVVGTSAIAAEARTTTATNDSTTPARRRARIFCPRARTDSRSGSRAPPSASNSVFSSVICSSRMAYLQRLSQGSARLEEMGFDGALGQTHEIGDDRNRTVGEIVEDDRLALAVRQRA